MKVKVRHAKQKVSKWMSVQQKWKDLQQCLLFYESDTTRVQIGSLHDYLLKSLHLSDYSAMNLRFCEHFSFLITSAKVAPEFSGSYQKLKCSQNLN